MLTCLPYSLYTVTDTRCSRPRSSSIAESDEQHTNWDMLIKKVLMGIESRMMTLTPPRRCGGRREASGGASGRPAGTYQCHCGTGSSSGSGRRVPRAPWPQPRPRVVHGWRQRGGNACGMLVATLLHAT